MKLIAFEQEVYKDGAFDKRTVYVNPANVTFIAEDECGYVTINTSGGLRQWVQVEGDIDEIAAKLDRGLE